MEQLNNLVQPVDTEARQCETHGAYTSRRIIGTRFSGCPTCLEESRAADEKRQQAVKEAEQASRRAGRIAYLHRTSGLIGRQTRATFDNYKATNPKQKAILADCQAYMAQFQKGQDLPTTSLWLLGKPGTGKSHLGAAMVNHLIDTHATPAKMHSGQEIIRMLRATWNRDKPAQHPAYEDEKGEWHEGITYTEDELIQDIAQCSLLVLDEVGISHGSNAEFVQLFEVLDLRYKLERPTVLLSNLNLAGLKAALTERVFDRLREGATVKACDWDSYRGEFPTRAAA